MLHTLLHFYNAAPPEAKSAARAGAAFLTGAALAVLATACSPAYAGAWHRNQMQPNQPQTHAQQAQAASKSVAKAGNKGGHHGL